MKSSMLGYAAKLQENKYFRDQRGSGVAASKSKRTWTGVLLTCLFGVVLIKHSPFGSTGSIDNYSSCIFFDCILPLKKKISISDQQERRRQRGPNNHWHHLYDTITSRRIISHKEVRLRVSHHWLFTVAPLMERIEHWRSTPQKQTFRLNSPAPQMTLPLQRWFCVHRVNDGDGTCAHALLRLLWFS